MDPFESYSIDKKSDIPIWVQLKQYITYLIAAGTYAAGDRLPTVRDLAIRLGINYHTVNKVYRDLEDSGLIEVHTGSGTYVSDSEAARFLLLESDARIATREYISKLLDMGLTPQEIVHSVAACLGVPVTICSQAQEHNRGRREQCVG